jgi:hypothetical protein
MGCAIMRIRYAKNKELAMYKYTYTIIVIMLLIIVVSVEAMENNGILIKTSDNKNCWLPQWKIESSRLLHIKQELQAFKEKYSGALPAPIILKTICQKKLQLFSDALDEHDFAMYFKNLSDKKKNVLLNMVGPQELDSPYFISQFFSMYCPQDLIEKYLSTTEIATYLQGLVIADNCKHKNFTQTAAQKYERRFLPNIKNSYNNMMLSGLYSGYYCLPPVLTNVHSRFSGITNPSLRRLSNETDKSWLIQNYMNNANKILYFFTPVDPVDDKNQYGQMFIKKNKKKLWALFGDKTVSSLQKIIEHTNAIEGVVFSNDGRYLATSSTWQQGELMLSDLEINNNKFISSDVLLTGHKGLIGSMCFNKKSTILAAVSMNCIYMWNIQKKSLITQFDCQNEMPNIISFNHDDSRFVSVTFNVNTNTDTITLWDSTDITNIFFIKSIAYQNQSITSITFTSSGDKLIIETKIGVIVLNGLSGEVIMETGLINQEVDRSLSCVHAVLMPYLPMLITMAHNDRNQSTIALWDINTNKRIALLLEDQKDLVGIGLNPSGRSIILITTLFGMITVELYNNSVADSLNWIKNKSNLLQRYLLHRLYVAQKNNELVSLHPDSPEYRILQNLPTAPCAVKEMIEKYLPWKVI